MDDLDAAIRAELAGYMQGDSPARPIAAVERVLDECAACDRDGVLMSPGTVRNLIARELGATQAGTP